MHHSGEVVNAMLKVPHTTIGKLFFFFKKLRLKATFAFDR